MRERAFFTTLGATLVCFALLACGSEDPHESGGGGSGGGAGTLNIGGDGGPHAGNGAGKGGAGSGGLGGAAGGAAPEVPNPPGATVLGPYELSTGYSAGGEDWMFKASFGSDGNAWFVAHGNYKVSERMPISGGLIRFPTDAGLGPDYFCPGPNASWGITSGPSPDETFGGCRSEPCTVKMILPEPSVLKCTPGSGSLKFSAAQLGGVSTLSSSISQFDSLSLKMNSATFVSTNPIVKTTPRTNEYFGAEHDDFMIVRYTSEPEATPEGKAPTTWTLSNISILYRRGRYAASQLICAAQGKYHVTDSEPFQHSMELDGVSALQNCPGEPVSRPIVVDMYDN